MRPHLRALDDLLREQIAHFEPEVRDLAGYCLESTGKRLRPLLVFLSGWRAQSAPDPLLVRAAAVIEMTHLATLVHDDIMDHADLRRGRPTVSSQKGPAVAVLLGDALFAQSVWLSTQFPDGEVCRSVAESTRRVCSGEIIQTLGGPSAQPSRERYERIIDLKTAELFRLSCRLGASLTRHAEGFIAAAGAFGGHLGLAYQIYDDLVDFVAPTEAAGKTLGTDWASGKATLPVLLLLERTPVLLRSQLLALLRSGAEDAAGEITQRMRHAGVFVEVAEVIRAEIAAALITLKPWDSLPAAARLGELCRYLHDQVNKLTGES